MGFKPLILVTSANNLEYTIKTIESIPNQYDCVVFDDASTDPVKEYCDKHGIYFYGEYEPKGLTNLWNKGFQYFLDHPEYTHLIFSNNDVIYSADSISRMYESMKASGACLIGPMSNKPGANTEQRPKYGDIDIDNDLLVERVANLVWADGVKFQRMTRVNGFCFMVDRSIKPVMNTVDCLFPPHFINTGNEDWLCDELIHAGKIIGIAKQAFVFHYKAVTTRMCKDGDRNKLWREKDSRVWEITRTKKIKPKILCTADRAMGLGDGIMLSSTLNDLSENYDVRIICSESSYNVVKLWNGYNGIEVFNMNQQGLFYTNDFYKCYNLIYWDTYNTLRQYPHHALNMIRKTAELPLYTKDSKRKLPDIPIPNDIEEKVKRFFSSFNKPIILTSPLMSYWNKMIDNYKYLQTIDHLMDDHTVIQIGGGNIPKQMAHTKAINLIDQTSLEQSLAMIKHADLVISCDSFIQHAASHMKTPAVVMFCGTSPEEFGYPYNVNIFHPEIAGCQTKCARPMRWLYDYDYKDRSNWNSRSEVGWVCPSKLCERAITVEEIVKAAKRQLSTGKDRDWSFYDYTH